MLVVNALAYSPKLRKFVSRSPAVSCIVLSMHWIRIDCGHHIICHVSVTIHMINGTLISSALYAGPPHWFRIIRSANIYIYSTCNRQCVCVRVCKQQFPLSLCSHSLWLLSHMDAIRPRCSLCKHTTYYFHNPPSTTILN